MCWEMLETASLGSDLTLQGTWFGIEVPNSGHPFGFGMLGAPAFLLSQEGITPRRAEKIVRFELGTDHRSGAKQVRRIKCKRNK